jgi:peptide deformylase
MIICKEAIQNNENIKPYSVLNWKKIAIKSDNADLSKYDFDKILEIGSRMVKTCLDEKGVGLAAPQVGIYKNIIIVQEMDNDVESYVLKPFYRVYINPTFSPVKECGKNIANESCLSVPLKTLPIERWTKIQVRWKEFDLNNETKTEESVFTGFKARVFQHELNHLNKVSIVDVYNRQQKV